MSALVYVYVCSKETSEVRADNSFLICMLLKHRRRNSGGGGQGAAPPGLKVDPPQCLTFIRINTFDQFRPPRKISFRPLFKDILSFNVFIYTFQNRNRHPDTTLYCRAKLQDKELRLS